MPPPQRILALKIRGFVCRSCFYSLEFAQQRRQWLSRSYVNGAGPRSIGARDPKSPLNREIHFYDETTDGYRIERSEENIDEEECGPCSDEELERVREESGEALRQMAEDSTPTEYEIDPDLAGLEADGEKIQAIIDMAKEAGDLEKLSPEQRLQLGDKILGTGYFDSTEVTPEPDDSESSTPNRENEEQLHSVSKTNPLRSIFRQNTPHTIEEQRRVLGKHFPVECFPAAYRTQIQTLQKCIDACIHPARVEHPDGKRRRITQSMLKSHLSRSYLLARKGLMSVPSQIPSHLWTSLWTILGEESQKNTNRMAHIKRLGEDMEETGFALTPAQHLLFIESVFLDGHRTNAINRWKEARPHITYETLDEYWEIGIRMLSNVGRIHEALQIAESYFNDVRETFRYRALIPLLKAYLLAETDTSVQHAWAIYIRLRVNLGKAMTMDDYDAVISIFMEARQPDLALAVFRDMMLTGDESETGHDSTALCRISGIISDFKGLRIQQSELEWKNTRELSTLPAKFKNKYFFGKWLRNLIGDGQFDAAKKVIDLMQDHGIQPSPMHMNGLIGAWFRQGTEREWIIADELAWKMIKVRLESMDLREFRHNLEKPLRPSLNGRSFSDKSALLFPPATIETFTLLVQQYRQRQKLDALPALFDAFRRSRIPPITRYMNQLLLLDTRSHTTKWAWQTYLSLTESGSVKPNFETFVLLWNLMKRAMDPTIGSKPDKQPSTYTTCRKLFAEMMKWKMTLIAKENLPRELYDLIILSFSFAQDQAGTAVAMRALQRHFDLFPNEDTIRTVILQLSRLGLRNKAGEKPRRLNLSLPMTKERINTVMVIFHNFKTQRIETLAEKGIVYEQMTEDARLEETILTVSDVLQHVASARLIGEQRTNYSAELASERAATQMGVTDCHVWKSH